MNLIQFQNLGPYQNDAFELHSVLLLLLVLTFAEMRRKKKEKRKTKEVLYSVEMKEQPNYMKWMAKKCKVMIFCFASFPVLNLILSQRTAIITKIVIDGHDRTHCHPFYYPDILDEIIDSKKKRKNIHLGNNYKRLLYEKFLFCNQDTRFNFLFR